MSIGIFNQKQCPPKENEILKVLGPRLNAWNELSRWIGETFSARPELKFMYGKNYGWAVRFQVRSALLTALYPMQNGFTAQVILNRAALEQVEKLNLGKHSRQAIDRAHLYTEGKWLFIPVESQGDAEDLKRMLKFKAAGGKKRASTVSALASNG